MLNHCFLHIYAHVSTKLRQLCPYPEAFATVLTSRKHAAGESRLMYAKTGFLH